MKEINRLCKTCNNRKPLFLFQKRDGVYNLHCNLCLNDKQREKREIAKDWVFPFGGLNDPEYIKDRDRGFAENGNGWWFEHNYTIDKNGWWKNMVPTSAEVARNRRMKQKKMSGEL
jgi:hypothetical protein|tara:strand:+ start:59 stop:406 length:348 start_codon:yes stop_codon:yes gene_type:complete